MAPPLSQLAQLSKNLTDIHDDIGYFAMPLGEVHTLLADVQKLLGEPKSLNDKLKEILNVLEALEEVCKAAAWLPEVGQGAKAAGNLLDGINTFIRDTRKALSEIESGLKPVQGWIKKVQIPLDKGWSAIADVEGRIETVANVSGQLDKRYKGRPPANIDHCAELLNMPVQPLVRPFNDAKDITGQELNRIEQPLRVAAEQLRRMTDYTDVIDRVYGALGGLRKLIASITGAVKKAADYGEAQIKAAISAIGKKLSPKTFRKVKAMLAAVQTEIDHVKQQIVDFAFKPVKTLVDKVRDEIKKKLADLPVVKALQDAFDKMTDALEKFEKALVALPDPCAKMLSGVKTSR